jgi:hypothetical protein
MATTDDFGEGDPRDVEAPRGRTSFLTIFLIVLNIGGIAAFASMLWLDMQRQDKWTRSLFLRHLALVGLPTDKHTQLGTNDTNPEHAAEMEHYLDPPAIKEAYAKRNLSPKGKFLEVKEVLRHQVRYPIEESLLKKYFELANQQGKVGDPVGSLDEELDRVKNKLPAEIDQVAADVAAKVKDKGDDIKKQLVRDILYPVANEGWQIGKLELALRETSGEKLDKLLVEAAKRKMLYDILKPMEIFRPVEVLKPGENEPDAYEDTKVPLTQRTVKRPLVDRVWDLKDVPTEKLMELLNERLTQVIADTDPTDSTRKRTDAEKRRAITFLLLAISQVEVPGNPAPPEAPKKDEENKPGKKDDQNGMVNFAQDQPEKKDKEGEQPKEGEKEKEKEPSKEGTPPVEKKRPPRNFAFTNFPELRVEVVCGLHHFNQACTDLSIVLDIMEKQTVQAIYRDRGDYLYPITGRIHDPALFTRQLIAVMKEMPDKELKFKVWDFKQEKAVDTVVKLGGIRFMDEDGFKTALEAGLKAKQGKITSSEQLLEIIYEAMKNRVAILETPEDDKEKIEARLRQFEVAVDGLLYAQSVGFTEKYQAAIKRIQDMQALIEVRKRELRENLALNKERAALLETRKQHEFDVFNKLLKDREETWRLAKELKRLQQELFLAQVDLVGAHDYNLYLENHLRQVERKMLEKEKKGGKGK